MIKLLAKDKTKEESRKIKSLLSFRIEKLRTDLMGQGENINPNVIHNAFQNLAVYCFENLQVPNTHHEYIGKNLMNRDLYLKGFNSNIAIDFIRSKMYIDIHGQNLEFALRSVEALIDYNEENLSYEKMFYILDYIFEFYTLKSK